MGIIQRQSIKGTAVFIFGSAIQFFMAVILVPNALDESNQAIFRVYASLILMFSAFGYLGMQALVLKHLHEFEHKPKERAAFNTITLSVTLIGAALSLVALFSAKTLIYQWKGNNNAYLLTYFYCVPVSVFFSVVQGYFEFYSIATHRLTAPSITKEIVVRGGILLCVVLYYFKQIDTPTFFLLYTITSVLAAIINFVYCYVVRGFRVTTNWQLIKSIPLRQWLPYSNFIYIVGIFAIIFLTVDQPTVYSLLGARVTDIYSVAYTLASMVTIPYKPLSNILTPFMYEAWHNRDLAKLDRISKESSLNLSIVGSLLFLLLAANLPNLLGFLPEFYRHTLFWPMVILGFGRVLDYLTGVSTEILLTSPSYKHLALYMAITCVCTILLHLLLIPKFGAIGASIVVAFNLVLFNALKYVHLLKRYQMQPIHKTSFVAILIAVVLLMLQMLIPQIAGSWLIDSIVRSAVITIIYSIIVYKLGWIPELNKFVDNRLLGRVR